MTNFERIKEMKLYDLAVFLCENTKDCEDCAGCNYCTTLGRHANGMVAWLMSEEQDDGQKEEG